jgi:GDP-L-fucose synthase
MRTNPDYVIHTAAKVGGIGGNEAYHADFFLQNIKINTNVIDACRRFGVKKLLAFSSVCVFPDGLPLLEESKMHDGPVYESNFAYGYAKRMVDVHIRALEKQYGIKNYCSIIPGNIFGKHDMYSIEHGHIIPSLTHKLYNSVMTGEPFMIWGDGFSRREFIYVNDLAKLLIMMLDLDEIPNRVIISGRENNTIRDVVWMLTDAANFSGRIIYDTDKPNGQRNRPTSKAVIDSLFPDFKYTPVQVGIDKSWNWFVNNYSNVRTKY